MFGTHYNHVSTHYIEAEIKVKGCGGVDGPLVSIIVPVYNVEDYLGLCLRSIQGQTWRDIEVWLVDDGSGDGSGKLCDDMAAADERFHVIHKANSGVSDSRNAALDRAGGKYLQFVDGDDYLAPDATETLVRRAEATGADLVIAHFYRVAGDRRARQGHIKGERLLTRQEFAGEMMKAPANFYYGVLWNKLYRRTIVEANQLRCEKDLSWCEDFLFNLEYIKYARLIAAAPRPVYYYVKREDSLVMSQSSLRRTIQMKLTTFAYYKDLYQTLDLYEERKGKVYRYLLSAATDSGSVGLPEKPKFLEELMSQERGKKRPPARKRSETGQNAPKKKKAAP